MESIALTQADGARELCLAALCIRFASLPTDDGPAATFAGPAARSRASRSQETDLSRDQVQYQPRIPQIMLLLPRLGRPDLRRVSHPTFDYPTLPSNSKNHCMAPVASMATTTGRARICLEASGNYSLDLALTLQAHHQVEVSVVNPRRARRFAESLGERSKTDPVDAGVLCEYAARMPWVAWQPPSSLALRLRAIEAWGVMHTQEKNREHALATSQAWPAMVIPEMRRHQRYLEHRMERLPREALRLIARDRKLDRRFRLMLTVPGIWRNQCLADLGGVSRALRYAGYSPVGRLQRHRPFSIYFRYLGAKAAADQPRGQSPSASCTVHARAGSAAPRASSTGFLSTFAPSRQARLQAVVAVMRKLLHALFAMFRSNQAYDGSKLCPIELTTRLAA